MNLKFCGRNFCGHSLTREIHKDFNLENFSLYGTFRKKKIRHYDGSAWGRGYCYTMVSYVHVATLEQAGRYM